MINCLKKAAVCIALAGIMTGAAQAEVWPNASNSDKRMQFVDYSPTDVVQISAVTGYITTITFSPGETVVNYGSGYSTAWEFSTAGNQFFLKPKADHATTNLVVITNKHTYMFDVRLAWNQKKATYHLQFRYPDEEKAKKEAAEKAAAAAAERKRLVEQPIINTTAETPYGKKNGAASVSGGVPTVTAPLPSVTTSPVGDQGMTGSDVVKTAFENAKEGDTSLSKMIVESADPAEAFSNGELPSEMTSGQTATGGTLSEAPAIRETVEQIPQPAAEEDDGFNWDYTMNFGSSSVSHAIAPTAVYDDGLFTVIRFEPNADIPTIYRVVGDDGETLVNRHIDESGAVVVRGVYPELRLRAGTGVVGIYNESYGKKIRQMKNGTTLRGMSRDIKAGAQYE